MSLKGKFLAEWLKDDYEINKKGELASKKKLTYTINDVVKEFPEDAIWFQHFATSGTNVIYKIIPTIKHSFCLKLAEDYKDLVKMETWNRTVIKWPHTDLENLHGYCYITNRDGFMGDGEVHKKTVNENMWPFINTMMMKRSEDRLILKCLGLYQQGYFSTEEFGGEMLDDKELKENGNRNGNENKTINNNKNVDDKKDNVKKIPDIHNLINELRALGDQIKLFDTSFNIRNFISEYIFIPPEKIVVGNISIEQAEFMKKLLIHKIEVNNRKALETSAKKESNNNIEMGNIESALSNLPQGKPSGF